MTAETKVMRAAGGTLPRRWSSGNAAAGFADTVASRASMRAGEVNCRQQDGQ
jgi:hypothetical protein